ncbi:hypothetical protein [Gemmobacter sp. 24YEA27]|uniref:hypothetical protein n=1 Tax=Gemmobacter sp. 24YEA27 TaxID=3040672 RepID=UPI0024B3B730|nr:hypothetical protein [Gemmobacter sp. 24YEA27]
MGAVRSYEKIAATSAEEHAEQAKARDADRQRGKYAAMSPDQRRAKSDGIADKAWLTRHRNNGMAEGELMAALAVRVQERDVKRAEKARAQAEEQALRDDPRNIFG